MQFQNLFIELQGGEDSRLKTALISLHRPKALNALNDPLMDELGTALLAFDADDSVGCIILTGSERAFAAGADIAAMAKREFMDVFQTRFITRNWETIRQVRKPVIAAVAGFALGGGCELAMMCDFIIAADTAKFGQPEIKIGIMSGAGGTQRLPRAIGKSKAMDLILTGRMMDAQEAERAGLVSRVVPADKLMEEALAAAVICGYGLPSVLMAKDCVNRAYETTLSEGIAYERDCSTRCSPPRTRRRVWTPSWRSEHQSFAIVDALRRRSGRRLDGLPSAGTTPRIPCRRP
jgi:enoyl-CoA hydratase